MRINESKIRRIIKEELQREVNRRAIAASAEWVEWSLRSGGGRALNEQRQGREIELLSISGRTVAGMLRDGGELLIASLIMNHDRPGASEYIWNDVLQQGQERQHDWVVDLPLENIVHRGMSLHDMGFRNGKLYVVVGLTIGDPLITDFSEKISGRVKINVKFIADDRYGKRVTLGELRPGGLRDAGRMSPAPRGLDEIKFMTFSPQDVSIDYLDHIVARREAAAFI